MNEVSLTIDGKSITAPAGTTILNAAATAGIDIPHLCYDPRVEAIGSCRLCGVKVESSQSFAQMMERQPGGPSDGHRSDRSMSAREIQEWMALFGGKGSGSKSEQ